MSYRPKDKKEALNVQQQRRTRRRAEKDPEGDLDERLERAEQMLADDDVVDPDEETGNLLF